MTIIIDGYNLLKQLFKSKLISEKERGWFLQKASNYAKRKRHTLYLVFDGGPNSRPTKEHYGDVVIVYSGTKQSADDVIKAYLEEKLFRDVLLVSTDRQLTSAALANDVATIDSLDFYEFMHEQKGGTGKQKTPHSHFHKMHPEDATSELDALMREGSKTIPLKDEVAVSTTTKANKVSKKERLMLEIMRKL